MVAARKQVGVTVIYDGGYRALTIPAATCRRSAACAPTSSCARCAAARSLDLQKLVHEDMQAHWDAYPHPARWNLTRPDANIDHRRVPNLMVWFERAGYVAAGHARRRRLSTRRLVAWDLGGGILHIGIVSDRRAVDRRAAGPP